MNCVECQEFCNAYLDGDLAERLRVELESHLASCTDCCCDVANWQACLNWLRRSFPEQVPPEELWERICACTKGE